jgi:hypothetical protein
VLGSSPKLIFSTDWNEVYYINTKSKVFKEEHTLFCLFFFLELETFTPTSDQKENKELIKSIYKWKNVYVELKSFCNQLMHMGNIYLYVISIKNTWNSHYWINPINGRKTLSSPTLYRKYNNMIVLWAVATPLPARENRRSFMWKETRRNVPFEKLL